MRSDGGETGPDDRIVGALFERIGASILGKELTETIASPVVTHLRYRVTKP